MNKEAQKKDLLMIGAFVMLISFLCSSNAFTATIPDSWFSDKEKADYNNTLLVASYNGEDTERACNLLNHYLLADRGTEDVNMANCICGFSYIDHTLTPDNLTICDVENGKAIPKKLRHADVLVLVYGGDEKKESKDRENFDNLPILHKRLMSQMFDDPQVVMLNIDSIGMASVSYNKEVKMARILHAERVESTSLSYLDIDRTKWIYYRAKRIGDRVDDDEEL
jgi:hypothetical protein